MVYAMVAGLRSVVSDGVTHFAPVVLIRYPDAVLPRPPNI